MNVDKARTIGENRSIFVGRTIARLKKSFLERPESSLDLKSRLPVSFRNCFAFRSRSTGGYDSLRAKNAAMVTVPD